MTYPVPNFADGSGGGTPLSAAVLNVEVADINDLNGRAVSLERGIVAAPQTVTWASTTTINASLGRLFRITATGDFTLAAMSNPTDGQTINVEVLASSATRTMTVASAILPTTGTSTPVVILSGKRWFGAFRYNSTDVAWSFVASTQQS